ncbi:unnamed protein product [Miscanthus lutarioriparius]|uniref:Uncharacterized protein n=1 Tax=Miscanthus lutarioriparius TaxID=422564 RepID=A0A811P3M7_9POAL|nr:unnamed protein product [Miscanthus lutarioriparius]
MSHWLGAREGSGNCRQQQDSFSILGNAGSRQQRAPILHHLRHRGAVHNVAEQSAVHVSAGFVWPWTIETCPWTQMLLTLHDHAFALSQLPMVAASSAN